MKLCEVIKTKFAGPLDLVIDDASHMYVLTKQSFEPFSLYFVCRFAHHRGLGLV